jgi:hypothetical protein
MFNQFSDLSPNNKQSVRAAKQNIIFRCLTKFTLLNYETQVARDSLLL